jgi:orotidine-5'-phosphate decarboxylase
VGAVVGATWPEVLKTLRKTLAGSILLLPGYGAQGAGAEDVVSAFDANGRGALVTASRSITFPWASERSCPRDWRSRIEEAVTTMRLDLQRVIGGGC